MYWLYCRNQQLFAIDTDIQSFIRYNSISTTNLITFTQLSDRFRILLLLAKMCLKKREKENYELKIRVVASY